MTEAGDTVVGGHERHDRARANGCHRSGRSRRNRAFLLAGLECPAHLPEHASGIRAELKVTLDLRLRQKIAGARDRTIDGDGVHDWPVGADRSATSRLLRQTRDGLRPRVLVGPRVSTACQSPALSSSPSSRGISMALAMTKRRPSAATKRLPAPGSRLPSMRFDPPPVSQAKFVWVASRIPLSSLSRASLARRSVFRQVLSSDSLLILVLV